MAYRGRVEKGVVVLEPGVSLPDGTEVQVEPVSESKGAAIDGGPQEPSIWNKLRTLAGTVEGPEDWAENHDHYIHGTPKRP